MTACCRKGAHACYWCGIIEVEVGEAGLVVVLSLRWRVAESLRVGCSTRCRDGARQVSS